MTTSLEQFRETGDRSGLFRIMGSGFLVGDNVVLTNRHVILNLMALADSLGLSEQHYFLQFNYGIARGHHQQTWPRFGRYGIVDDVDHDIGLIEFSREGTEPAFEQCQPVEVVDSFDLPIGAAVACLGFPFGSNALTRDAPAGKSQYRWGAILQQGYVSAVAPYDEAHRVARILLDIRTSVGMSGSPIFLPATGKVIGVHDAGIDATVAFAVPLSADRVKHLIDLFARAPIGQRTGDMVPTVLREAPGNDAA